MARRSKSALRGKAGGISWNRARTALVASIGITALLYTVPALQPLGWPFILLSTLAHELGHGLAAIFVGCRFEELAMYADASGVARWAGNPGRVARACIAAGGLLGPAVVSAGLFFAATRPGRARVAMGLLSGVLLLTALLWVRNLFGLFFVLVLAGGCALAWTRASAETMRFMLVLVAVQLSLSVFSRGDYLFTATARTSEGPMPSDVAHIEAALILPYWVWGAFVGLMSVAILFQGSKQYLVSAR